MPECTHAPAPGPPPRVAVVLLNWNGLAYTREAVASVRRQTVPNVLCVVVDNGSAADEVAALRALAAEGQGVLLVENRENLGFSGGNNRGAEAARERGAAALLFLNNDATLAPDALERLLPALALPDIGAVSPTIYHAHAPRSVWFGSGETHLSHPSLVTLVAREACAGPDGTAPTGWACGCALLMRTDLYFAVGGFDEGLFAYHEDVDLSLKVRASGRRCAVVPGATAWHVGGGTDTGAGGLSPRQLYYLTRNASVVALRHGSRADRAAFRLRAALRTRLLAGALLLSRGGVGDGEALRRAASLLAGEADGRVGRAGSYESRQAEVERRSEDARRRSTQWGQITRAIPAAVRRRVEARAARALGLS